MIETAYLLIIAGQVYLKGWAPGEKDVLVPPDVVEWCGVLNNMDVYNIEPGSIQELRLFDCYSFRLQYYGEVPPIEEFS